MNYDKIFKEKRERYGITLKDMAKRLNISDSLYSKYEKNVRTIPIKHLNEVCNIFNISIDYAFNLNSTEYYKNNKQEINQILFSQRLRELRKKFNLTQEKLAKILNTSHSVISAYENGKTLILTSFLYTICKKYKISADYLLGKIDTPKYLK